MSAKQKPAPARGLIILILVLVNAVIIKTAYISSEKWYWVLIVTMPLLLLVILPGIDRQMFRNIKELYFKKVKGYRKQKDFQSQIN